MEGRGVGEREGEKELDRVGERDGGVVREARAKDEVGVPPVTLAVAACGEAEFV